MTQRFPPGTGNEATRRDRAMSTHSNSPYAGPQGQAQGHRQSQSLLHSHSHSSSRPRSHSHSHSRSRSPSPSPSRSRSRSSNVPLTVPAPLGATGLPADMALAPSFTPTMVNSQSGTSASTVTATGTTVTAHNSYPGTVVGGEMEIGRLSEKEGAVIHHAYVPGLGVGRGGALERGGASEGTRSGSVTRAPSLRDQKSGDFEKDIDGEVETQKASSKRSLLNQCLIVLTVTSNMVINTANSTAMSIALPTVEKEWRLQPAQLQWMMSAYPLSSGCLFLVCGRLADVYGRKRVFLLGAAFLAVFTLACGFAQDIITLDILRGIQGVGSAATIPASLGILAQSFPPSRARSLAFATFSAGAPVGAVFGTAIGGVLTEYTSQTWRSSFYLLAGLTFLVFIGAWVAVDKDVASEEKDKRIDWIGAFLVTSGLVFIVFVLGQGEVAEQGWETGYIIALLIIGVILTGVFLYWQHYLEVRHNDSAAKRFLAGVPVEDENGIPRENHIPPVNSFEGPPKVESVHSEEKRKPRRRSRLTSLIPFVATRPKVSPSASPSTQSPTAFPTQSPPRSRPASSIQPPPPALAPPTRFQLLIHNLVTPPPLMKLSIWTRADGRIAAMMAIAFTNWCAFMSWTFWVQLYYQNYLGYGPMLVVVRLLPMFVSGIGCNVFVGLMAAHVPVVWLVGSGAAATTLACLLFAVIDPRVSYWGYAFVASILSVMGADFVFSAGTLFISKFALPHEQSVAGALFNTMTQLGTAVGVTVTTVIYNSVGPRIRPGHDNLLMYRAAQWGSFAFGCIATTLAIVCFIGVGVVGHKGEKPVDLASEKEEGGIPSRPRPSKSGALAMEMDARPDLDHGNEDVKRRPDATRRVSYGGSIAKEELMTPPDTPTTALMSVSGSSPPKAAGIL